MVASGMRRRSCRPRTYRQRKEGEISGKGGQRERKKEGVGVWEEEEVVIGILVIISVHY